MAVKDEPLARAEVATDTTSEPAFKEDVRKAAEARQRWEAAKAKAEAQVPPWKKDFTTVSGMEIPHLVTADQVADIDVDRVIGVPGEYPYTRGVHPTGYRGKLWTMRQFAGFGTAADTNQRFKYLLSQGQTGLSTAFHLPTLYGYDSDHEMSTGEVGKCGVAVDTLADMEALFDGIPLGEVTTSMTINSTAPILFAMYLAVAEKQGVDIRTKVSGTLQNDILKEYIAQKEYIFPPRPSMRLITDQFSFAAKEVPRWNTISISGYHIREAGSTALQELAFTLRDGMEYVQYGIDAGLDVDEFAPRLSFFFNSHNDFFEEIAKFRARAADLGDRDARALRRQEPALLDAPLPHPDRRLLAHRPAALQQRGADHRPGAGRGPGRHAVAAHELARRDARAAHRGERRASRCAPSRSWPTSPGSSTRSIRSAGADSSKR